MDNILPQKFKSIGIYFGYNISRICSLFDTKFYNFKSDNTYFIFSNIYNINDVYSIKINPEKKYKNELKINQVRKLLNKEIPKYENFKIKESNDFIGDRIIEFDNYNLKSIIVKEIIYKFFDGLFINMKVNDKLSSNTYIVFTIPAYFEEQQIHIIEKTIKAITNCSKVFPLEEPIAAKIYDEIKNKNKSKEINDNHLVITIYNDFLELSIISVDKNLEYYVKKRYYEINPKNYLNKLINKSNETEIIIDELNNDEEMRFKDFSNINLISYIYNKCIDILKETYLNKNKLKSVIITEDSDKFEFEDNYKNFFGKEIEIRHFNNKEVFVKGASIYAYEKQKVLTYSSTFRKDINKPQIKDFYENKNTFRGNRYYREENLIQGLIGQDKSYDSKYDNLNNNQKDLTSENLYQSFKEMKESTNKRFLEIENKLIFTIDAQNEKINDLIKNYSEIKKENENMKILIDKISESNVESKRHNEKIEKILTETLTQLTKRTIIIEDNLKNQKDEIKKQMEEINDKMMETTDGFNQKIDKMEKHCENLGINLKKKKEIIIAKNIVKDKNLSVTNDIEEKLRYLRKSSERNKGKKTKI